MLADYPELREAVVDAAVRNIPRGFLEEVQRRAEQAYQDTFQQVNLDPSVLGEQKIHKLRQDRAFRMEFDLAQAAMSHKLPHTAKPVAQNDWSFCLVSAGEFALTQSYVSHVGALPQSAKFREDLAAAAVFPRLPLDAPAEVFELKNHYGLLAHNPVGAAFTEDKQKLGTIQLCIPHPDMKAWAAQVSLTELLSFYPAPAVRRSAAEPTWRKKTGQSEAG